MFARISHTRDFLMREEIFPFHGINMPEFQRERSTRGSVYLNIYTKFERVEGIFRVTE